LALLVGDDDVQRVAAVVARGLLGKQCGALVGVPDGDNSTATKITIGGQAGTRLGSVAAELVLHPIANGATDYSEDVVLYKAITSDTVEIPFMVDEERVVEITFTALIDESRDDGDQMGLIGDSST